MLIGPEASIAPVMVGSAAATAAGLWRLERSRRWPPGRRRRVGRWQALSGLAGGLGVAGMALGWPVGIAVWLGLAGVCGFAVSLASAGLATRGTASPSRPVGSGVVPRRPEAARRVGAEAVILAALAGCLASAAVSLAMARWLPVAAVDRAMLGVVLWPLLWAWAIGHLCAEPSWRRGCATMAGIGVAAAAAAAGGLAG